MGTVGKCGKAQKYARSPLCAQDVVYYNLQTSSFVLLSHFVVTAGPDTDLDRVADGIADRNNVTGSLLPNTDANGRMVLSFEVETAKEGSLRGVVAALSNADVHIAQCEYGDTMEELNMADALHGDMPHRIEASIETGDTPLNLGHITDLIRTAETSVRRIVLTQCEGTLHIAVFTVSQIPEVTEGIRSALMDASLRIPKEAFTNTLHTFGV
ncbi:hypothetical protein A2454_00130 [Candidatus Peribacteria bacterium RIFOXYC2_FULL_55_14]|nr:MAG: hypothetical protein A2198_02930 [Candidatus Peribacteria bacterium RIFOXYA1_FULL_56_14]OGJ74450.1 MAG: hypothetical protein A2217_01010 [Candidatus Peribacteria bacterium RIFOXYA2_FULL_55_28]OGJ75655.1 MAG: hypothetical protein A2384_03715 [Candidatus Peribacteria bacterium RIFOXYB1_FULL_54_35]OGJ76621.1 MAG: hypothetical protein A2327_02585 [Candidatus Peribacteria bacterium RIFOXYB2_FULL_54_17]OGJ76878.1 MAG: hypothetical protein A2424_01965 [Candidatus Peribacteria bacterium RIFOXYC